MVAREAPRAVPKRIGLTFKASDNVFLERVLFEQRAILLSDVTREIDWRGIQPLNRIGSSLGVPHCCRRHSGYSLSRRTRSGRFCARTSSASEIARRRRCCRYQQR